MAKQASKLCKKITIEGAPSFIEITEYFLGKIDQTTLGKKFLKDLGKACGAKSITIKFKDAQGNMCAAWGGGQYVKLVEQGLKGGGDAGTETKNAIDAWMKKDPKHTLEHLAQLLGTLVKPSLSPNFKNTEPYLKKKIGPNLIQQFVAKIEQWQTPKTKKSILNEDPAIQESLIVILKEHWTPGSLTNCSICFHPTKFEVAGEERPLECALFHELVHAYYSVQGKQLSPDNPPSERNTLYEAMCLGLPPHFHDSDYCENKFRKELKVKLRESYAV
ncbi:M91 family zinc metallopeptidase [Planctomycetota bacterium]